MHAILAETCKRRFADHLSRLGIVAPTNADGVFSSCQRDLPKNLRRARGTFETNHVNTCFVSIDNDPQNIKCDIDAKNQTMT